MGSSPEVGGTLFAEYLVEECGWGQGVAGRVSGAALALRVES